jgi:hypothetical protein
MNGVCAQQKDVHTALQSLEPKLRAAIADTVKNSEEARAAQETAWGIVHKGFEQKLAELAVCRIREASLDRARLVEDHSTTLERLSALQAQVADQIADFGVLHHQLGLKVDLQSCQLADSLRETAGLREQLAEHAEILHKPMEGRQGELQALSATVGLVHAREKEPDPRGSHSKQLEGLWAEVGQARSGRAEVERLATELQRLGAVMGNFLKETECSKPHRPITGSGFVRRTGGGFTQEPLTVQAYRVRSGSPNPTRDYSYDSTLTPPWTARCEPRRE